MAGDYYCAVEGRVEERLRVIFDMIREEREGIAVCVVIV